MLHKKARLLLTATLKGFMIVALLDHCNLSEVGLKLILYIVGIVFNEKPHEPSTESNLASTPKCTLGVLFIIPTLFNVLILFSRARILIETRSWVNNKRTN